MTIQLIADGMQLAKPDATWRVDLPVTADAPYPAVTVELVPDAQDEQVRASSIRAMYSIDGNPIGLAIRSVAIVRTPELIAAAPTPAPAPGVDLALPAGQVPPDLTVRIERAGPGTGGQLLFQMLAADPSIDTPDAALPVDIGDEPAADLQQISGEMQAVEGKATQFAAMRGIGLTIADRMPLEFWDVLRKVAALHPKRAPSILFLSAEPYVPWELALVDPPLDPTLPPVPVGPGDRRPLGARSAATAAAATDDADRPRPRRRLRRLRAARLAAPAGRRGRGRRSRQGPPCRGRQRDHRRRARVAATAHPQADVIHFAVHGSYWRRARGRRPDPRRRHRRSTRWSSSARRCTAIRSCS